MKIKELQQKIRNRNQEESLAVKTDVAFQIGRKIMEARLKLGMTQEMLAEKMKTKQPAIARLENGSTFPNLRFLDKMAKNAFNSYLIAPSFAFMEKEYTKTIFITTHDSDTITFLSPKSPQEQSNLTVNSTFYANMSGNHLLTA